MILIFLPLASCLIYFIVHSFTLGGGIYLKNWLTPSLPGMTTGCSHARILLQNLVADVTPRPMYIIFGLLFILSWTSVAYTDPLTFDNRLIYYSPPYFESVAEFTKASRYLLQRLPFEDRPYWNSEARKNFGFGIIVGIAKELAYAIRPQHPPQRYQALQILSEYIPQAWNEYNHIVNETRSLLIEADTKIQPVVNIINAICIDLEDRNCDRKVEKLLKIARFLRPNADLLLQLGSVSKKINGFSNTFDSISEEGQEIPFLQHHADDPYVRNLMKELYKTYSLINNIE